MATKRVLAAVLLLACCVGPAHAAETRLTAEGTFEVDGSPTFPIGLSDPPPLGATSPGGADALAVLAAAGIDVLRVGPHNTSWSDATLAETGRWDTAAAAHDMHTWVNLRELARAVPGSADAAMLARVVSTLRGDPGLGLWKGADEPWWNHWDPSLLEYPFCLGTSRGDVGWCQGAAPLDADHLWVTIEAPRGTGADLAPYSAVTDGHGVDVYPVAIGDPDPDLHQVGAWTQTLAASTPDHAVWTTLQICSSGSSDGSGNYVLPTRLQERYMIYDAIINGARALAFFGGDATNCFSQADAPLKWNWTFWNGVLGGLVAEIGHASPLYPALLVPDAATDHALASSDPSTELLQRRVGDELWVMAARSGAGNASVSISGLPAAITGGSVYEEDRSIAVSGGTLTDVFDQWAVHVYRLRIPPPPDTTPPDLAAPADVSITTQSAAGAVVAYQPCSATDADNPPDSLAIAYSIPSGATFPVGITTVTCTASDPAGNAASAGFAVRVTYLPPPPPAPRCIVPRLHGLKLLAAERALSRAHCRAGRLVRRTSHLLLPGRVITSNPAPRATRPRGTRITLVLARRPSTTPH